MPRDDGFRRLNTIINPYALSRPPALAIGRIQRGNEGSFFPVDDSTASGSSMGDARNPVGFLCSSRFSPLSPFPAQNQRAVNSIPAICALVSLTSTRLHPQIADRIADIPYILESYRPIENRASRRKSRTEKFQRLNKGS